MPSSATPVQIVNPDTNQPIRPDDGSGGSSLATSQVVAGTSNPATQLAAARTGRRAITVMNLTGAQKVWLGSTNAVTSATGILLPAVVGASVTLAYSGALFGISETAAQTVGVAETY